MESRSKYLTIRARIMGLCLAMLASQMVMAQEDTIRLPFSHGVLEGSLRVAGEPAAGRPLVIFVAGSGPTDRNGNQPQGGAATLKLLADSLAQRGVSTFRYDKRNIGRSVFDSIREEDLRFDTLVSDLGLWIGHFEDDDRFDRIILAGHSEGALVATLAADRYPGVDGLVTLAGAGRTADTLIMIQLERQPPFIREAADSLFRLIRAGQPAESPPFLMALFRPSVQPYLRSWMMYDPAEWVARLEMPVLVVQGGQDLQVFAEDADRLAGSARDGTRLDIQDMNHILKAVSDQDDNIRSYTDAERPLHPLLISGLMEWIQLVDPNPERK